LTASPFRYYDPRTGTYQGGTPAPAGPKPMDEKQRLAMIAAQQAKAREATLGLLPPALRAQADADPAKADRFVASVAASRAQANRLNRQIAPEAASQMDFDARDFSSETIDTLIDYVHTRGKVGGTAMPSVHGMPPASPATAQPSAYPTVGGQGGTPVLPAIIMRSPAVAAAVLAAGITDPRTLSDIARAIRGAQMHEQLSRALPQDVRAILASAPTVQLAGLGAFEELLKERETAPGGDIPVDGGEPSFGDLVWEMVKAPFEAAVDAIEVPIELVNRTLRTAVTQVGSLDDAKALSWREAWKKTESGQMLQRQIEDAKARWSPQAVDVAVRIHQASQSDNPAAEIARIVSEVSANGSQEEQDLIRAAFGGYGVDDGRHQSAKELLDLVSSSNGGSFGDVLATEVGLTAGTSSYTAVSGLGTTVVTLFADPYLIGGKIFTTYRAAMWGMERMVGPTADISSLFYKSANEGLAGAHRRRMVTRLWDEVGSDVAKYLDAPKMQDRAKARALFVQRWSPQFGEKTSDILEELAVHQVPGQAKAGVRDASGAYSYLEDQTRVLNIMFGRSGLITKTIPRLSAPRLQAQRVLAGSRAMSWDTAGRMIGTLYGPDPSAEFVAAKQGTEGLTSTMRAKGLAPTEQNTFRYSQTAARVLGGVPGSEPLVGVLEKATDAPRLKPLRAYAPKRVARAYDRFGAWFSQHPASTRGIATEGDDVAADSDVVYRLARTFTSKGHAALLRQAWMEVTPAQRRSMWEGMIRTMADAKGYMLGFANRDEEIDRLVRAYVDGEQYAPIILGHRRLPANAQASLISEGEYRARNMGAPTGARKDDGTLKLDADGRPEQFVPPQDTTFDGAVRAYGGRIASLITRRESLADEVRALGALRDQLRRRIAAARQSGAAEADIARISAEMDAATQAIQDARQGIRANERESRLLQGQALAGTQAEMRDLRRLASDESKALIDDGFDRSREAYDVAGKLIRGEINSLGQTAEQALSDMGNAVARATGGDVSDPAMAAAMTSNAKGRPAVQDAKKQARDGARDAMRMGRDDSRLEQRGLKRDINQVLRDTFGIAADELAELARDWSETQRAAFLEMTDDASRVAKEMRIADADLARLKRRLSKERMDPAERRGIIADIDALRAKQADLRRAAGMTSWEIRGLVEERKAAKALAKDGTPYLIDESNPFWSPSLVGGKHYALHRYQTSQRVRMPDMELLNRYSTRVGVLHSLIGMTWSRPAATATNLWSLGVLAGPRFALRNSLEEWAFHLAAGGSMSDAMKGRAVAHSQLEMLGASTGPLRKRGKDLRSGKKMGLVMTESRSRAAAAKDTERLLDADGNIAPEVMARSWWRRSVLPYLNEDEVKVAQGWFAAGDSEKVGQLLHAAVMRRMFAGKSMSAMDEDYVRAAYTRFSASVADEVADSVRLGMSGQFEGDPKALLSSEKGAGSGWRFFDDGQDVVKGFQNIPASRAEDAAGALHHSLQSIFLQDGPLAQIVAKSLHRHPTVAQAYQDAVPRLVRALNEDATRKAFAEGGFDSLGPYEGFKGWADDMVAASSPREFAERYFASLAHNLSDSSGLMPNKALLDKLWVPERNSYAAIYRNSDGDLVDNVKESDILAMFADKGAENPPWVLGRTMEREFSHLIGLGDRRLAVSDEFWRHMGMMNSRMSRLPIFHANSMNAYAIAKPAEDMIAALLRGDIEGQAQAAKLHAQASQARERIEQGINDWWDEYSSAVPDGGSVEAMPMVWRGKTVADAVDYVTFLRRELKDGNVDWVFSPSRGEFLPRSARTRDAVPVSHDEMLRAFEEQKADLRSRIGHIASRELMDDPDVLKHPAIQKVHAILSPNRDLPPEYRAVEFDSEPLPGGTPATDAQRARLRQGQSRVEGLDVPEDGIPRDLYDFLAKLNEEHGGGLAIHGSYGGDLKSLRRKGITPPPAGHGHPDGDDVVFGTMLDSPSHHGGAPMNSVLSARHYANENPGVNARNHPDAAGTIDQPGHGAPGRKGALVVFDVNHPALKGRVRINSRNEVEIDGPVPPEAVVHVQRDVSGRLHKAFRSNGWQHRQRMVEAQADMTPAQRARAKRIEDLRRKHGRAQGTRRVPQRLRYALASEGDMNARFGMHFSDPIVPASPTDVRPWAQAHPLNQGNYRLKAINQLHEDEVVRLRSAMSLDADEADEVAQQARKAAAAHVVEWAQHHGMASTMMMADNPAMRTTAAYHLRNLARFYRATEDFYRRAMRMGRYHPQGVYKMALAYDLLSDAGGSAKDDQGNEYFVYSGVNAVFQQVSNLLGVSVPQDIDLNLTGQYSMLSPSLDAAGWVPTLSGPLAAFAYAGLKNAPGFDGATGGVGQFFRDNEGFFLGRMSQGRSLMEQTIPTPLLQLLGPDGVAEAWMVRTPEQRREMQMRIAKDAALADWLQNGYAQPGMMDAEAQADREAGVYAAARNMMTMRYLLRFLLPASPQVELPRTDYENLAGVTLNPVFAARVRELTAEGDVNAFGTATAEFSKLFPQLPLLQESVNKPSQPGARPAATKQSAAWMHDHASMIEAGRSNMALPFLIPAQAGEEYYFPANTEARRIGAKVPKGFGEYRDALNVATRVGEWFELSQQIAEARAMAPSLGINPNRVDEIGRRRKAEMRAGNKELDEWLRNTTSDEGRVPASPVTLMSQVDAWVARKEERGRELWPHEAAFKRVNKLIGDDASAVLLIKQGQAPLVPDEKRPGQMRPMTQTDVHRASVRLFARTVAETAPDYQQNVINYVRAVILPQMGTTDAYQMFRDSLLVTAQKGKSDG
jgi:hypothetical protein